MRHEEGTFTGLYGLNIFTQAWLPDEPPRAAVILVHGYAEHSSRYGHVAACLVEHGYAVYALDLRGHGQSEGRRVYVGRFDEYVADLRAYRERVRAAAPGLPVFVYGHSMGSLIGLLYASGDQGDLAGLITAGTALRLSGANPVLAGLVRLLSAVLPTVRLGPPLVASKISRDPAVVQRYEDDPLVDRGAMRLRWLSEMLSASRQCIKLLPTLTVPYLALHGSADTLTLPEGADIIRQASGAPDTTVRLYDGMYHEVHNELGKEQALDDIVAWLDAHLPA
jgi:acylglycerol lipase